MCIFACENFISVHGSRGVAPFSLKQGCVYVQQALVFVHMCCWTVFLNNAFARIKCFLINK